MKKSEAIKILVADFHNNLIAQGYTSIEEIENEDDKEIAKVLKIKFNNS